MRLEYPNGLSYEPFWDYIVRKGTEFTIKDDAPDGMKEKFDRVKKARAKFREEHEEK